MGGNLIHAQHEGVLFSLHQQPFIRNKFLQQSCTSIRFRHWKDASVPKHRLETTALAGDQKAFTFGLPLNVSYYYCTILLWHSCGFLGRLWTTEKVGGGLLSRRAGSLLAIHFYNLSLGLAGMEVLEGAKKLDGLGE